MDINEIELFQGIDGNAKEEIIKNCSEQSFSRNSIVFQKGEPADYLYILLQGEVNLIINNEDAVIYSLTEPGEAFGWSSIVEKGIYSASCTCLTDIKVMRLGKDKIDDIFNRYPKAAVAIYRRLGSIFSKRMGNAFKNLQK